jgi:hypothetical protein
MRRIARGCALLLVLLTARARGQGGITGTVYDSLRTRAPLANATVVLVERARYATTDARGRFRFDSVPDGQYTVGFSHALLDSLDLELPLVVVRITGQQPVPIALATPSPGTLYNRLCPAEQETDLGVIVGVVRDVDTGRPLANATVSTEWSEFRYTATGTIRDLLRMNATTDPRGVFRLCHMPTDVPVDVAATGDSARAGPIPLVLDERRYGRADFALSLRDSAAARPTRMDSVASSGASRGTASYRGIVRGPDGRVAREATVRVLGTTRTARTDAEGAFALEFIPAGTRAIELRAIGSAPMTVVVDFATGAVRDTVLTLRRAPPTLAAVAVTATASPNSLMIREGFETRRRQGLGAFLTAEDLVRMRTTELASTLANARGLHVEYGTGGFPMPYLRGTKSGSCIPNYFVDGVAVYVDGPRYSSRVQHPFSDLSDALPPEKIRGIEVYSSPGTIPAQFDRTSSTGCGSIVIWTR